MSEIACIEVVPETQIAESGAEDIAPNSRFAQFVEKVKQSADKKTQIDQFMAQQKNFPILEGENLVHFVYRGKAEDVTITGDHVGRRYDHPMHRIEGTDFFYSTAQLEPDARITYRYTLDLQRSIPDPLNPRQIRTLYFGRASYFGMPRWRRPTISKRDQMVCTAKLTPCVLKARKLGDSATWKSISRRVIMKATNTTPSLMSTPHADSGPWEK